MRHVPADVRQTGIYPVSLENQPGCRSVSDDDLCAWCSRLCYRPGELSLCRLFITEGSSVRDWLRLQLASLEREEFTVLFLDNQHRLIAHETLFTGTINHTQVHPREVVKSGLKHNAAAIIVAHCHPSGLAEPGQADRQITERLRQALNLVDIRLLDHLVVGGMDIVSFAERGWL
ncbi:DNA repair protein RadC [Salmonella enterica subsp. enterica serovar Arechavaleta]|nr:DNA repair protein RadC [Salmonella enterica subsp. enterica serovar Arechavaleta]